MAWFSFWHKFCEIFVARSRRRITRRHFGDGGYMKKIMLAAAAVLAVGTGSANAGPSLCDGVAGNLIQNCGFESGSFSSWNTSPALTGSDFFVDLPGHTGSYDAWFGAVGGTPDVINQAVATLPGHLYHLEFYFKSDGATPNGAFAAYFDTSIHTLGSAGDIPVMDWTYEDFFIAATTNQTRIFIGAQDLPGHLQFDDFVLRDVTVPEPFTLGIFGAGLMGAFAMRRRKRA